MTTASKLELAEWCSKNKLPEQARAHYEAAIGLQPNSPSAYIKLGDLFRRQKKLPQAIEAYQKAIALNFYIGVTGPVTYKNAEEKRKIIAQLPLDKLLIETDAPFLTPVPQRGKRNEPAFVTYIADKIAEIHRTTREQVAQITAKNAAHLFGWEADA